MVPVSLTIVYVFMLLVLVQWEMLKSEDRFSWSIFVCHECVICQDQNEIIKYALICCILYVSFIYFSLRYKSYKDAKKTISGNGSLTQKIIQNSTINLSL